MEERKWEDLETDCLVNVLGRVGMESLLLDVPFVCKSWHKASLNPLCWRSLVFPLDQCFYSVHAHTASIETDSDPWFFDFFMRRFIDKYGIKNFSVTSFIKFIVDRSCNTARVFILHGNCSEEALKYVANECPGLKTLDCHSTFFNKQSLIQELIPNLKNLEELSIVYSCNLKEILVQVSRNCKNFMSLGVVNAEINQDEALFIVTLFPKIKELHLKGANIDRKSLETLFQGCKELVHLDVSGCIGFETDEKILELASHIKTFQYEGSIFYYDGDD